MRAATAGADCVDSAIAGKETGDGGALIEVDEILLARAALLPLRRPDTLDGIAGE